ncbi:MAG: helicase-exonuclease AddAB subunit AddA [Eubacteriaceae bacterium]|jgi:ATP-dependent helicase/nuclease subunit A|nr:helicase-exonuclease AddAB subunit AddA [Eubacteriaceae bacterium]
MKWTDEQLEAIEVDRCNVLVSAAAGSGKTALLIERLVRLILDKKADVDELLVLTFTRAAAGEVKERLRKALQQALIHGEDSAYLQKQMALLPSASISTIHAFCSRIVRTYFQEAEVDPAFTIGNEAALSILYEESMEAVFEEHYLEAQEKDSTAFTRLVDRYSGNRDDRGLVVEVDRLYRFLSTVPEPRQWCDRALESMDDQKEFFDTPFGELLRQDVQGTFQSAASYYKEAQKLLQQHSGDAYAKIHSLLQEEASEVEQILKQLSDKNVEFLQEEMPFKNFPRRTKAMDETIHHEVKNLREKSKTLIRDFYAVYNTTLQVALNQHSEMRPYMATLVDLCFEVKEVYRRKKSEKGYLDFNDLEEYSLKILKNPDIAEEIKESFTYIFIDEYQDTNQMQESILSAIARDDNYYMVGDVKQSIYRFRRADPTIFVNKYRTFPKEKGHINRLLTLSRNFRSSPSVIHGVNDIFSEVMSENLGGIPYDSGARLYPGRKSVQKTKPVTFRLLDAEDAQIEGLHLTNDEIEAHYIAEQIQTLVNNPQPRPFHEKPTPYRYRDIAILMRSAKNQAPIYNRVFKEKGIPTFYDSGENYYETSEVLIVLNLLTAIDNRQRDLPMIAAMLAPFGGFSSEEVAEIRQAQPETSFVDACKHIREEGSHRLSQKLKDFDETLTRYREKSRVLKLSDFIWYLYLDTGYYDFVGAMPGGSQRQENLRFLLEQAEDYQQTYLRGMFNFVQFVENMKKRNQEVASPLTLSEKDDVVRMMTIHKSKGLEFPVVLIAGMGKRFNIQSERGDIIIHPELGFCPKYIDWDRRIKVPTTLYQMARNQLQIENTAEEARLLYVAMTRAEEKLEMVGCYKNLEKVMADFSGLYSEMDLIQSTSYGEWVMRLCLGTPIQNNEKPEEKCEKRIVLDNRSFTPGSDMAAIEEKKAVVLENKAMENEINRRLDFTYPVHVGKKLPVKIGVTALQRLEQMTDSEEVESLNVLQPLFEEETITPMMKGHINHYFLQMVDVARLQQGRIEEQLLVLKEEMIHREQLTEEEAKWVEISQLSTFFNSDIGRRYRASDTIKKEWSFNMMLHGQEIDSAYRDEEILVQGIIDACFLENGKWILLDFKTDRFMDEMRLDSYRKQITFYGKALEKLTPYPVGEKYLCFISLQKNEKIL